MIESKSSSAVYRAEVSQLRRETKSLLQATRRDGQDTETPANDDQMPRSIVISTLVAIVCLALGFRFVWNRTESATEPSPLEVEFVELTDPLFDDRAVALGIEYVPPSASQNRYSLPTIMGTGCAMFDYDLDGLLDVFVVGHAQPRSTPDPPPIGRLFRQLPDGQFDDVTADAGLTSEVAGMGVAVGDVNNDAYPDLYVTAHGRDLLFVNQGNGRFEDITESAGIINLRWGTSACFLDFDRDGWLDLFVTNYVDYYERECTQLSGGHADFCGPHMFRGTSDKLFRNVTGEVADATESKDSGHVRFVDVSVDAGIAAASGAGLGVIASDLTGDGLVDIYVANDQTANFLWVNQGDGSFHEEALLRGCAYDTNGNGQASMGIALVDTNGDLTFELLLTHLDGEFNTLYQQHENQFSFGDASASSNLGPNSLNATGFGTAFGDLDLDGDSDLLVVNGRVRRPPGQDADVADFWSPYRQASSIQMNNGSGEFNVVRQSDDAFLTGTHVARGLAIGDLENDGDLDVVVTRADGTTRVLHNNAKRNGNWIVVRATDPHLGDRDAFGAIVTLTAGETRWRRLIQSAGSYLSAHDPRAHFGIGPATAIDEIEVEWPDGFVELFPAEEVNRLYHLQRGMSERR